MADEPIEELGGKTPIEYADTPAMDRLAPLSEVGLAATIPDGMKPGSDTANLAVLGLSLIHICTNKTFDVHMMVEEPGRYVDDMKKAGADLICVHQEACTHLDRTINQIKEAGLMTLSLIHI